MRNQSSLIPICQIVWRIADELRDRQRVIRLCVALGIDKGTASTQCSLWRKARGVK